MSGRSAWCVGAADGLARGRSVLTRAAGFTLVEVMIVVAIVGILSALALPAYGRYVQRAARAEGRSTLLEAAQFMQRFYSDNNRYDADLVGNDPVLPNELSVSPPNGQARRYNISLDMNALTPLAYTLQAVPTVAQANDGCGTLTLNSLGVRGASVPGNNAAGVADCWK